jgi:hypothetical protein
MPTVAVRICVREGGAGFARREVSDGAADSSSVATRIEPRTVETIPLTNPGVRAQSQPSLDFCGRSTSRKGFRLLVDLWLWSV